MHVKKPLLGFGWMGWALLVLAGALVVVWVTGYDLQYQLFAVTHSLFGDEGVWSTYETLIWLNWSTLNTYPLGIPGINMSHFGLWGVFATLIAFHVYPKKIRSHWWAAIVLWGSVSPLLMHQLIRYMRTLPENSYMHSVDGRIVVPELCLFLAVMFLLGCSTKSKWVVFGVGALVILSPTNIYFFSNAGSDMKPAWPRTLLGWYVLAWNPLLLAVLLSWAIPARIRYNRWWLCFKCNYNMRNLETNTCPECGGVNERMPANATAIPASE